MKITYKSIGEFTRKHGRVTLWTAEKDSLIIGGNEPDFVGIVETAPTISFQAREYPRKEFEKLMSEYEENSK